MCIRILLIFLLLFNLTSCTNKKKDMVFVMQSGDFNKTCQTLLDDISYIKDYNIKRLQNKKKLKIVRNTIMFYIAIPTVFLSLLFVDFSGNESQEIILYEERITHLNQIFVINKCKRI